jgi:hypothetical protein
LQVASSTAEPESFFVSDARSPITGLFTKTDERQNNKPVYNLQPPILLDKAKWEDALPEWNFVDIFWCWYDIEGQWWIASKNIYDQIFGPQRDVRSTSGRHRKIFDSYPHKAIYARTVACGLAHPATSGAQWEENTSFCSQSDDLVEECEFAHTNLAAQVLPEHELVRAMI